MTDSPIQLLAWGLIAALLAVQLVLALTSWAETSGGARPSHENPLLFTRPFAIRAHIQERRFQLNALRRQYPVLGNPHHGRRIRDAVRRLQPTRLTATLTGCLDCRGSRMRGLPRCPACSRPLVEPAHAAL